MAVLLVRLSLAFEGRELLTDARAIANLPDEAIAPLKNTLQTGVHFGYAQVAYKGSDTKHDEVLPMVMSIGWNPYYKNEKRTAVSCSVILYCLSSSICACLQEVHLLHEFPGDFYGSHLKVVILGFVRPEYNYPSMGQSFSPMYTSTI